MRKNKTNIAVLFILIGLSACISDTKKETKPEITKVEPAEIIFDENEGEASLARNFYILFDGSGSMGSDCSDEMKMKGAKTAFRKYLQKIPEDINLGLLVFGVKDVENGIKELVPLGSNNREELQTAVDKLTPMGETPLGYATIYGTNRLVDQYKKQLGYGEYRLIIITDGKASDQEHFEKSLLDAAKYPFIAIYGIGLCIEGDHLLKTFSINYTDAHDYEQLGKALEETMAELPDFDPTEFSEEDFVIKGDK